MKKKLSSESYLHKKCKYFSVRLKRMLAFFFWGLILILNPLTVDAQQINLNNTNITIKEALREVEKQSKYSFFYNNDFADLNKRISIQGNQLNIQQAMEVILKDTQLDYKIVEDNLVVISPKEQKKELLITGTVTDYLDKTTLPGVSIMIKGTSRGTVTNIEGQYQILAQPDDVLVFTFVGMETSEMPLEGRSKLDIAMLSDIATLQEVVVVGYGTQRKRDLSGSVTSVKAEDIEKMSVASIDRALQGRAAGVQVTSASGVPGGGVSINIRGRGSISGSNQPLYIVDGVQVSSGNPTRRLQESNALAGINFDDIESIDILKDASAIAIYGAQGANGVVIITTKRGRQTGDEKTKFNFQLQRGYTQIVRKMDVMNGSQWAETYLEAYRNRYGATNSTYLGRVNFAQQQGWVRLLDDGSLDFSNTPGDDWQDAVFRTGNILEARLSARGGTDKTKFYISGSFNTTEGHVIASSFDRATFRINLDHKINNSLSFDNSTSINVFKQNTVPDGGRYTNPMRGAIMMVPTNTIRDADGNYSGVPRDMFGNIYPNIVHDSYINHNKGLTTKIIQSFGLNWKVNDMITFRSSLGSDVNDVIEDELRDPRTSDGAVNNGLVYKYHTRYFNWQSTNTLNIRPDFGPRHSFSTLFGFEYKQRLYESISAAGSGLPSYHFDILSATATPTTASAGYSNYKVAGFFGRANYTLDDKYISQFTLRYDGSSRFGESNQWGLFPSASFAWRISAEPFMSKFERLDDLKIRISYGTSGTMAGLSDFSGRGLFSGGPTYLGQPGIAPSSLPNPDLNWEESTTINTGISMLAFKGRINLDADIFRRTSTKLLLSRPIPSSNGWSSITQNVGKVQNDGIELSLNTVNVIAAKFKWATDFNVSFVQNEILELLPGQDYFSSRLQVGRAIDDYYTYHWAGVNPADGRPMWYDKDGNITYRPVTEDRKWFGPFSPTSFGGFNNTFSYGNLSLSVFFQFAAGHYIEGSDKSRLHRSNNTVDRNQYAYVYDRRWQKPGDMTDVAQSMHSNRYAGDVSNPYITSSLMFERADYLRLKDISLSYNFPKKLVSKYGFDQIELFATATNLLVWHDYDAGYDPELLGSDQGTYPQGKVFTFGIKTNF